MATSLTRLERVYMQDQSDFLYIPGGQADGLGTATLAAGDAVRHIRVSMNNEIDLLVRRDKTGSRTATQGTRGRASGRWSYEGSVSPSGVAGDAPDIAPLLKSVFGAGPTTGASGKVPSSVYGSELSPACMWKFVDSALLPFTMWSFRTPSGLAQRCAFGCIPNELTFNLGQDIAELSASGECKFVIDSYYFDEAGATIGEKGGISAFPSEPASPVTAGGIVPGFKGVAKIGGTTIARIRTATVKINCGTAVVKDNFGSELPDELEGDMREVTVAFSMYDSDDAIVQDVWEAATTKAGLDIMLAIGSVAGNMVVMLLKNVQLASHALDDGQRKYVLNFPESRAYGTDLTSADEITLWYA